MTPFDLPHRATSSPSEARRQREYRIRDMPLDVTPVRDRKRYAPPVSANDYRDPFTATGKVRAALRGRGRQAGLLLCILSAIVVVCLGLMAVGL